MKRAALLSLVRHGKLNLVGPSENMMNSYSEKSESHLESAKLLFSGTKIGETVSLLYYSVYGLVLVLFFRAEIKSENHNLKKEQISVQYYVDFELRKKDIKETFLGAAHSNSVLMDFPAKINNGQIKLIRIKFNKLVG